MTKKDYILIANHMSSIRMSLSPKDFVNLFNAMCDVCEKDNPRFDKERFTLACHADSPS